ncbi:nucleolar and coiled-body phosphoprotein 1-like [Penaeus indicus]|uniref:nucleolar and coiled-body phosphoprotein 1-like n=1 Tax=Penaeus indicus TaxID=29960 RepID=UPI00300D20A2
MNGEGVDSAKSDANGNASKKGSLGGGLRNFRMDKEDTAKGQMSLLRYFRNEGKKNAKLPAKDKSDTESPKSTSPVLKSRQAHNKSLDSPAAQDADSQTNKTTTSAKKPITTISVHTTTSLPDLDAKTSSKTVIEESDDELGNGGEKNTSDTSPVIQRKTVRVMEVSNGTSPSSPSSSSTSTTSRQEEKKAPIRLSKPLFVQPPSPDQKDYDAETDDEDGPPTSSDNPLGGVPMKVLINSLSPSKSVSGTSMDQDQDSQDGIFIRVKPVKRARLVVSDDDDDDVIKPPAKKMQLNGHSDSDRITGEDDEKIEQYIETFESLYPKIDKMEMMDVFRKNEWDAQLTIRDLDKLEKERKQKFLQEQRQKREEERNSKNSEKELQQMKKNAKRERVRAQKESWKAKAAARIEEQDMEEEEEDYNFGGSKVYDR